MDFIDKLNAPTIQQFIREHENDDVHQIALKTTAVAGVPIKFVVAQIAARQKAKSKLPEWYATQDMLFPPMLSMEQCSSEATAQYKAGLLKGDTFIDLTGGSGVDSYYLYNQFKAGHYVEQEEKLVHLATHNFKVLGTHHMSIHHGDAINFIKSYSGKADAIYVDPARRGDRQERVHSFEDCNPNVITLLPLLLEKANSVLIKASPMLDISKGLQSLGVVSEIHIVAVNNECKEVLYLITAEKNTDPIITAVNIQSHKPTQVFAFRKSEEEKSRVSYALPHGFLYEPNAAVLKAGAFQIVAEQYDVSKLHPNTHLYTSVSLVPDFPGRIFKIKDVIPYQKKALWTAVPKKKANITVRNFPEDVKMIRKKTGIKDGGDHYIFAFTDMNSGKRIAVCEKIYE